MSTVLQGVWDPTARIDGFEMPVPDLQVQFMSGTGNKWVPALLYEKHANTISVLYFAHDESVEGIQTGQAQVMIQSNVRHEKDPAAQHVVFQEAMEDGSAGMWRNYEATSDPKDVKSLRAQLATQAGEIEKLKEAMNKLVK